MTKQKTTIHTPTINITIRHSRLTGIWSILNKRYGVNRAVLLRSLAAVLKLAAFGVYDFGLVINDLKDTRTDLFAAAASDA